MSKAIINNKLYDTDRAALVVTFRRKVNECPVRPGSQVYWTPTHDFALYRTAKGNYFEHDQNTNEITPRSEDWSKDLILRLYPDKYIEIFGPVEEA